MEHNQEHNQRIQELFESNDLAQAKTQCLTWLKQNPNADQAWHWLGLMYAKAQELLEAKHAFQHAIMLNPNVTSYHVNISNVLVSLKDQEKATQHLLQALKLDPNHVESFNNLGRLYYFQCLYLEAIPYLEKALRIDKDYWEAHYNLAHCYTKLNQVEKARTHYLEVIRLHPEHKDANFNVGLLYFESQTFDTAQKYLKKALALNPQNATAAEYLAHAELKLGNAKQAITGFETALLYSPKTAALHHNLAVLYLRHKNPQKALQHFEETLVLQPENATAKHMTLALKGEQTTHHAPQEFVKELFDQYADYYDQHVKESLKYAVPGLLRSALSEATQGKFNSFRVLDLGCGTGLCGIYFRDLAKELIGIDLSPKMIEKAANLGAYDKVEVSEALEYLSRDTVENFDLILAADVLVYFGELKHLFEKVSQKLNSGGYFIFTIESNDGNDPNGANDSSYYLKPSGRFSHSSHYIYALSKNQHFKIILEKNIIPRENEGKPIFGKLFVLKLELEN